MTAAPTFSVVIPAYGRPDRLAACLRALRAQTLPRERFEVIVCDDGSPEALAPMVEPFRSDLDLTVITQPNAGPAAARNRGARQARGAVLAFTDDDCTPAPDWLARLDERVTRLPDTLIGGAITNLLVSDPYATATQLVMDFVYRAHEHDVTSVKLFSTSNLAVPAQRFRELGGFDESFATAAGEDYDFCARWHHAGYASVLAPEVVVGHAHGHTLASFWRQHAGYGRALLHVRRRIARRSGRQGLRLEAPRFYAGLVAYPLQRAHGVTAWRSAALVLLSQVATGIGAVRELLGDRVARPRDARHSPPSLRVTR